MSVGVSGPKPDAAETTCTLALQPWMDEAPNWAPTCAGGVSQPMLPPSIPNFTPSPLVHSLISKALGEPCPKEDVSPSDVPELGLLELVAARDVLENIVQLQGARKTFTTYPLLNRDVFSKQKLLPANERAGSLPGPSLSPCHTRQTNTWYLPRTWQEAAN